MIPPTAHNPLQAKPVDMTPDIWRTTDGHVIYMYSITQLEWLQRLSRHANAREHMRPKASPLSPAYTANRGHITKRKECE